MSIPLAENRNEALIKYSLNNISEALIKLKNRIQSSELAVFNFENNISIKNYSFDLYSSQLNFAIQLDTYSYSYEGVSSNDSIKLMSIPHLGIEVLKITDYQILIDMDEVIRFIKNYLTISNSEKFIA